MPLVLPGQEVCLNEPGRRFERHHHLGSYAAVVVSGGCREVGDRGRFEAAAGDVLVHGAFDGHGNQIGRAGAVFVNIPISEPLPAPFGKVRDLDLLVRTLERDPDQGASCLGEQFAPEPARPGDWPDELATSLASDASIRLEEWAMRAGLHPASVSRGFGLAYGMTPKRFRCEQRLARAARHVVAGADSLAATAAQFGFADQSHMTRLFVRSFGATPGTLRRWRQVRSIPPRPAP